ncbi:peroxiredoxin-1-like [Phyllostomus hastatus]|uniref:peroxiredoxin-1-like n=1 Tax=Phyllostomus hastatus TaxID=9423 RepID=UPI001E685392|nr:peroxiredoxin-1-like [Phyllostomus hastatus]
MTDRVAFTVPQTDLGSNPSSATGYVTLANQDLSEPECFDLAADSKTSSGNADTGHPAPSFKAPAVVPDGQFKGISLSDHRGKYVVLFHLLDITSVCPTEIIAFSDRVEKFKKLNCQVIGASVGSHLCHGAWINTPRKEGGLGPTNIPLASDPSRTIARDYGGLKAESISFVGLFVIDEKGILRQITLNDLTIIRSVDETLRVVQAFQFTDKHGEVCPAGWTAGSDTMKPDAHKSKECFSKQK